MTTSMWVPGHSVCQYFPLKPKMKTFVLVLWITIAVHVKAGDSHAAPVTNQTTFHRLTSMICRQSALVTLFDEENEHTAPAICCERVKEQRVMFLNVANTRDFLKQHLHRVLSTTTSIQAIRHSLNFLVICNDCLYDVLKLAAQAGDPISQLTMRHFSTWLFITHEVEINPQTSIDNVAWMRHLDTKNTTTETEIMGNVSTLLWMPEGRAWSEVLVSSLKDVDIFHSVFSNIQRGLNGRCLLVSTLQWVPQTFRKVVNGTATYVGASIDIIQSLSEVFNFTFRVIEPTDDSWGIQMKNGTWDGIIGLIERQEIDMTGCPYAFSADRSKVMDFTPASELAEFSVVYAQKNDRIYVWTFLIAGFSWDVYACGAVVFLVCIAIHLYIIFTTKHYIPVALRKLKLEVAFAFTSIALRQDMLSHDKCRLMSERCLLFSWACFCFLITAIYSGSLVASATVNKLDVPFNNLEDLVEQNEYTIGAFDGYLALEIAKNSKLAVYQKLYKRMKNNLLNTSDDYVNNGLNLVLKDRYALVVDAHTLDTMKAESCEFSVMKDKLFYTALSLGFPRRSPLTKLFLESFSWMSDTGVFAATRKIWQDDPKPCGQKREVSSNKLDLRYFITLFVACACGVFSGVVSLAVERWKFQRKRPSKMHAFIGQ